MMTTQEGLSGGGGGGVEREDDREDGEWRGGKGSGEGGR